MTQDKLIAMAKEAGFKDTVFTGLVACKVTELQAFANLIRKDQIEIDAGICEITAAGIDAESCSEAIRNQEVE